MEQCGQKPLNSFDSDPRLQPKALKRNRFGVWRIEIFNGFFNDFNARPLSGAHTALTR